MLGDHLLDTAPQAIYIASFSPHARLRWVKLVETTPPVDPQHGSHPRIVVEPAGYSYLYGYFNYNLSVDDLNLTAGDGEASFFLEFDGCGYCQGGQVIQGLIQNHNHPISTDGNGSLIIVGGYNNCLSIGLDDDQPADKEQCFKINGHHRLNCLILKFGRKRPTIIGLLTDKNECTGMIEFGPTLLLSGLNAGNEYYLTPRGQLTTESNLNWYFGLALNNNILYVG